MARKNMITNHSSQYPLDGYQSPITEFNIAYHAGPPAIGFAGRQWQRGVPQMVSAADWAVMKQRSDCAAFDFRTLIIEPEPSAEKE